MHLLQHQQLPRKGQIGLPGLQQLSCPRSRAAADVGLPLRQPQVVHLPAEASAVMLLLLLRQPGQSRHPLQLRWPAGGELTVH